MTDNKRGRNFCTISYPEENPYKDEWINKLKALHCECYISPLHTSDKSPDDEGYFKPHHHVMICYPKITSLAMCKEDCATFGGISPIIVRSKVGSLRYFCHLDEDDNSGKKKYSVDGVISLNGGDYQKIIGASADKTDVINEMLKYIEEENLLSFYKLAKEAQKRPNWMHTLTSSGVTFFIVNYLKSRNWTPRNYKNDVS